MVDGARIGHGQAILKVHEPCMSGHISEQDRLSKRRKGEQDVPGALTARKRGKCGS